MPRLDAVLAYAKAQPQWFVYAIFDHDAKPVYVGATSHPERRYKQHLEGRTARWQIPLRHWVASHSHAFEVLDTFPDKRTMLDAEREYIAYLRPQFNA